MIKLIISDIDGTLVPDGRDSINPEIFKVIMQLKEKGIAFAAASGRQFVSIKQLFSPIAEEIFYVSDGGGIVRTFDKILYSETMGEEIVKEMAADILAIPECDMMICGKKAAYVLDRNSKMAKWLTDSYHFEVEEIPDLQTPIDDEIVKVSLYHETDAEGKAEPSFLPKWQDRVQLSCAGYMWIDCSNKNANKGIALRNLQNLLHVTPDETMAFGDNINDLEMLALASHSYAIGNARDEVREKARFLADTNVNDGVCKELKKLLSSMQQS